jgi:hypothetical protein
MAPNLWACVGHISRVCVHVTGCVCPNCGVPTQVPNEDGYPAHWQDCLEDANRLPEDNTLQHNEIICTTPSGVGANLTLLLFVGGSLKQNSSDTPVAFHYDPPRIDFVQPFPVDALGQELTFYGANLADSNAVRGCRRGEGWGVGAAAAVDIGIVAAPAVWRPAPAVWRPAPAVWRPAPGVWRPAPAVWRPAPAVWRPAVEEALLAVTGDGVRG